MKQNKILKKLSSITSKLDLKLPNKPCLAIFLKLSKAHTAFCLSFCCKLLIDILPAQTQHLLQSWSLFLFPIKQVLLEAVSALFHF